MYLCIVVTLRLQRYTKQCVFARKRHIKLCFDCVNLCYYKYNLLIMNGEDIKTIRKKIGISQKELANRLNTHWRTVQNWEKTGSISHEDYTKLCAVLDNANVKAQPFYGGEQSNIHGDNIIGNNVTMNQPGTDKVLQLLQDKEKSLHKAQEQIDRLLAIIEKMAK